MAEGTSMLKHCTCATSIFSVDKHLVLAFNAEEEVLNWLLFHGSKLELKVPIGVHH